MKVVLALCLLARTAVASPAGSRDAALEARLAPIAATAPGVVGVSIVHLESGRRAGIRDSVAFPMQSTFKLPVALAVCAAIDRGTLAFGTPIRLRRQDMSPGVSLLAERHPNGGVRMTVRSLLDLMLVESDNTACDALLQRIGGPAAVTAWLREHGITDMRVDRSELELGNDWYGLRTLPPVSTWSRSSLAALRDAVPAPERAAADVAFAKDPRDQASPRAFTQLLALLQSRQAVSGTSTDTLLAMMAHCATGAGRLRGGLPAQAKLVHKTGTAGTWRGHTHAVNDVGIITLPGGGGHVAIAVLVRDVRGPVPDAERVIARVARAAFDAWNAPD